ncbi:MAG: LON peptidase substrate-binding domain-containing protein [Ignavibacteriaceae bacterium]
MNIRIPLFPLGIVVFPFSKYPLHIFEERYKKMVDKCLKEKSGFGIISQIGKEISKVGTFVLISEVLKKYDSGELDIIVKAEERFSVVEMTIGSNGYFVAVVEEYTDFPTSTDNLLLDEMQIKFENIIRKSNFHLEESFWINFENAKSKSFKIAEKSGLTLAQQQALLTIQNENERVSFLIDHFENIDKLISENSALKSIIVGDGFLN